MKNIFRRENALPITLAVFGLGLIGYNVATAVQPTNSIPDNILYTYLEKDVVTEKAGATQGVSGYQAIATLASAVAATPAQAADVQDVVVSDQPDATLASTFQSQILSKPKSTTTDGITRQRGATMTYTVQRGETLSQIAHKFGLKLSTVLWANGLNADSTIKGGQELTILPVDGVRHQVAASETVSSIAKKYNSRVELISVFNNLQNNALPKIGSFIVVPDGSIPDAPKPAPAPVRVAQAPSRTGTARVAAATVSKPIRFTGSGHRFPYGWCTYWAASKFGGVPWGGNAEVWPSAARAYGYAEGKTPRAGAIYAEPWLSGVGHVSYVERVNSDGSFTVSEMNYAGWGRVSTRTIQAPAPGTFIYH